MKASKRIFVLLASAAAAGGLAWAFYRPSLLVPEAPLGARLGLAAVYAGMFFLVLVPLWLPAVVPASSNRILKVVSVVCAGALFLLVAAAVVLQVLTGAFSVFLSSAAVVAACAGLFHWRAGIGKASGHAV